MGNEQTNPKDEDIPHPDHHLTFEDTETATSITSRHCSEQAHHGSILDYMPSSAILDEQTDTVSPLKSPICSNKRHYSHHRRQSSVLNVHNGITDKFISSRICKIAAKFWQQNIETLSHSEQLEVGCAIFFGMLSSNSEIKQVMKSNLKQDHKIEETSLRYLDMMGWLIRYLITDNVDLLALLTNLGKFHQKMGINISHFNPMLQAMHDTFSYYFEHKYNIEVKYALEEIFTLAAQFMTGQSLKMESHFMDITAQFQGDDIPFLKNLRACLDSQVGREYLYRYLSQTWCEEMAIFLKNVLRFKKLPSDKERFMVARDITKVSIQPLATFSLNLSWETRTNAMRAMEQLQEKFLAKETFELKSDFFSQVEHEVYKLIIDNHWKAFVRGIEILQSKSYNAD